MNHRATRIGWFSMAVLAALSGCRGATICEPPWSTSGLLVRVHNSDAYVQVARAASDVPHVACRAQADIPVQRRMWQESSSAQFRRQGGPQSSMDGRVLMVTKAINSVSGYYRVLGLGRGVNDDDCGNAALQACNEAIDRYWAKELAVRPLDVGCRLADVHERCPGPGGSFEPVALASVEPPVAPRTEPPLTTLVKKLGDERTRRDAINGLAQFFENAKSRAGGNVESPAVRTLLDQIVEPLAKTYVEGDLDDNTRVKVIHLLAETRDVRAGRAWSKALTSYVPGKPGADEEVQWAALAIGSTRYEEGALALGERFGKLDAGVQETAEARKNLVAAMLELKSPSWKTMLVERIRRPLPKDDDQSSAHRNEVFWQTKAAELIGALGDSGATQVLLDVLVDADKTEVAPAALEALVQLGEARKLSPEARKSLVATYDKLGHGSALVRPSGEGWRPALLGAAAGFGDSELVPWLLKQVKSAKGADAEQVRAAALSSAIQSMGRRDVPAVKAAVEKFGTTAAKDSLRAALENVPK